MRIQATASRLSILAVFSVTAASALLLVDGFVTTPKIRQAACCNRPLAATIGQNARSPAVAKDGRNDPSGQGNDVDVASDAMPGDTARRNAMTSLGALAVSGATSLLTPFASVASSSTDTAAKIETKSPFIALSEKILPPQQENTAMVDNDPLDQILWDAPKRRNLNTEQMSDAINDLLREREWFVTGRGVPELFSDSFAFSDPDVSLRGYESYCRQVRRLFDQGTARCEVICCSVTSPNTITVLWRNAGRVNVGPSQIELKPYVVTTTLTTDPNEGNLIVSQTDEFESDGLGLILYQVPALRFLTGPGAEEVDVLRNRCDFYTCKLTS